MRQMGAEMGRSMHASAAGQRVDWVDYAKGFCIVFVVMMHSTLGVENVAGQDGWLHPVVAFAKPFRMPDFFMISGLFLARVVDRDWRTYLDRKVVHFVYFYLLWTAVQFAVKAQFFVHEHGPLSTIWLYVESFWEPFGTLWFIYLLPIFFVVVKLARQLRVPPLLVWVAGAALEIAHVHTGSTVIDEFASRFVYFYSGYLFAPRIFALARSAAEQPESALAGLTTWVLIKTGWITDVGTISAIVTAVGIVGSLALFWAVRTTALRFLFERPDRFRIAPRDVPKDEPKRSLLLQPAK